VPGGGRARARGAVQGVRLPPREHAHRRHPPGARGVPGRDRGHSGGLASYGRRMRIVAGSRKGAKIFAPKGLDTRPTADRVREAVFNLVGPVDGATVLDLYAGSGAMGLEALSRGAGRAVFVESDRDACRTIERNLEKLRLTGARVACSDVLAFLASERQRYDLVLVDPPYELRDHARFARYLPRVLADDGLLVFETAAKVEPEVPLQLRTSRRYGAARLTLYRHP